MGFLGEESRGIGGVASDFFTASRVSEKNGNMK